MRTRSASWGWTGRTWVAHHRAPSGSGEDSQNSGPEYSSSGGAYTKNTLIPRRRSSRAHSVPVLDQERHTEQWQWIARASRRGNRIERSKPKHARDALLAVPLEVAQPAQRPLQMGRSLWHPVIRVARHHPRVELTEVSAGTCVLKQRRSQRYSPWDTFHGMC